VIATSAAANDIDGVHLDDYFYPYPENTRPTFPTSLRGRTITAGCRATEVAPRQHQSLRPRSLCERQGDRPNVEVGISPFGIWRPPTSASNSRLPMPTRRFTPIQNCGAGGLGRLISRRSFTGRSKNAKQSFPALAALVVASGLSRAPHRDRISINRPPPRAEIAQQLALVRSERQSVGFILFQRAHDHAESRRIR